jgi:hypothetical protein
MEDDQDSTEDEESEDSTIEPANDSGKRKAQSSRRALLVKRHKQKDMVQTTCLSGKTP